MVWSRCTPTVTYPDHTTLITGVWPAEHGIVNNTVFDPKRTMDGAWYWYAGDIRVPTLWDAAHRKGHRHGQRKLAGERERH